MVLPDRDKIVFMDAYALSRTVSSVSSLCLSENPVEELDESLNHQFIS